MADFVAVLKKTIDGLADNTPELRQRVYAKARETVANKLAAITPPPPQVAVDRQHKALEEAIAAVEAGYMAAAAPKKADDFDSILDELSAGPAPAPVSAPPVAPVQVTPSRPASMPARPAQIPASRPAPIPAPRPAPLTPPSTVRPASPAAAASTVSMPVAADTVAEPRQEARSEVPAPALRTGRLQTPPELEADGADSGLSAIETAPKPLPTLPRADFPARESATPASAVAPAPRRRIGGGLIAALVALVVVAGGGYGIWLNRDAFADLFGFGGNVVAGDPAAAPAEAKPDEIAEAIAAQEAAGGEGEDAEEAPVEVAAAQPEQPAAPAEAARSLPEVPKFTQRLHSDGTETDPGPAGGQPRVGEGTTLAAATVAGEAPAGNAGSAQPAAADAALPVGQRAIFYEERTTLADGSADQGAIVWSLVQESPGGDRPPEPAIRAEVTVPSRDLSIRMTIRRNADASLPASHIVEMIFITSGTFEGGGVESVLRIAFKNSEAAPGAPLIGIPAKIADGYFLVALSDNAAESNQNIQLMQRESWIDIPIVYRSGRRALVTMEKGIPGNKVFEDAIRAWRTASAG
ncbi:MAG: hypothetical protein KF849_13225 [Rhizobiaceae bacterium]|nr:hypothetical protein [Rhizobiaceae bacterium]